MYDFTLTEEQEALRTMVREFVDRVVKPMGNSVGNSGTSCRTFINFL